jgi:iron complex transport system substrate-binding protein
MPNVTEMLFFLGLGERMVGRSDFCDYPPEAAALPSIGGMVDTSLEAIIALKPDLVVAYQGNSLELVSQLRQAKINVVAFKEATTVAEIGAQMEELFAIAQAPGVETPVRLSHWHLHLSLLAAAEKKHAESRPSMYYGYPDELSYTCGPGSFIDDLMTLAGARNVVPAGPQRWPQVGAEFILASQPQWLLLATSCTDHSDLAGQAIELKQSLATKTLWKGLPAVERQQVLVLDANVLLRPGPRILDAVEDVRAALHPDWK